MPLPPPGVRAAPHLERKVYMPKDANNHGYFLEYRLYEELRALDMFDAIHLEDSLRKALGWQSTGVDHLLVKGDYVIAIQTKWRCTRRREDSCINNFLTSLAYTINKSGKKLLFGLWVSRLEPFKDNQERLLQQKVYTISCFDSIDDLVKKTRDKILALV